MSPLLDRPIDGPRRFGLGLRTALSLLVAAALLSCASPLSLDAPTIHGVVYFQDPGYRTQATLEEIASSATVSLIDTSRNVTVASTLTNEQGGFSLSLPRWRPVEGQTYYLEAIKGLGNNVAGRDAVRLRTLVRSRPDTGWMSITGSGATVISKSTTTISTVASLKGGTRVDPDLLIGSLSVGASGSTAIPPDTFNGTANFDASEFEAVWRFVDSAVTQGVDPLANIAWDSGTNTFTLATPFGPYIRALNPNSGSPGSEIVLEGLRFLADTASNSVYFNGVPATVVSATTTALRVRIPANASTGYVHVTTSLGSSNLAAFMALARIGGTYRGN